MKYRRFFESVLYLFKGYESYAEVSLAFFFGQMRLGDYTLIVDMCTTRYLSDQHILFDYLVEDDFGCDKLARYKAIFLLNIEYASDK